MPEAKRKVEEQRANLGLEGFDKFFDGAADATTTGDNLPSQMEKLLTKLGDLITLSVDQRVETTKIANQLIENQRQLVATQQILIRLMERSIELTRHITMIEEKLPAVFELPGKVEALRARLAQLEGVEID
jgi:outer membrane PBP1 activator LpoA protein